MKEPFSFGFTNIHMHVTLWQYRIITLQFKAITVVATKKDVNYNVVTGCASINYTNARLIFSTEQLTI